VPFFHPPIKRLTRGKIKGFEVKCQPNSPAKNRPLKPPRTRSKVINQQQRCVYNEIAPQMRIKSDLTAFQPGLTDFLLLVLPPLLLNCSLEDLRINSDFPCGLDQVLMADRIRLR
jgi:hypothetical protein